MKVFISGASGLLGGNSLRYFKEKGIDTIGSHFSYPVPGTVYFDSLNSHDPDSFDLVGFHPDVIVHCGALTHVDYCETHPEESYEKTVLSTQRLVEIATKINAKLVFISTDYVFDGQAGPYKEDCPENPINIYGRHKLEAEKIVMQASQNNLILRITNVYGDEARGKNFVSRIADQCRKGAHVDLKLPFDQFATPTNAFDIARAMFLLVKDDKKGIYHISGSDYMNRVTLALKVLSFFPDVRYDLETLSTVQLNQPAPRPLFGGLIPFRFLSEYPDFLFGNLDTYLNRH